MPTEKNQLLEEFNQWVLFVQSLNNQSDEIWDLCLDEGKWSIREVVSHIMKWDKYFLEEAINKISTKSTVAVKHIDFDEFNNKAKIYGKTTSIIEISEKAIFYRVQICNQIRSLTDEQYMGTYVDGDGNPFLVTQYLKDFIEHDQHHINQIKNIRSKKEG
ncbi:DinB family protein [Paenibacillus psychroresistens]|uniref:DinB family protein n=1 Tax=Paenibacillus psychroresistens TaxID=1778678 RepID=A0A6B8RJF8_9BACL|nr:DinB family protein [Paenibacillus psychroresistens]QGQ95458.1 DinB family protein [Paenibacillus psychroresistens]